MHAAPPVRINMAPDVVWRQCVALLLGAAAGNMTAWVLVHWHATSVAAAAAACLIAACVGSAAWLRVRRYDLQASVLTWDGQTWWWVHGAAAECAGEARVMVDVGPWLLLRFAPTPPGRGVAWRAVSQSMAGSQWPAWRAALYARRPGGAPVSASESS